MDPNWGNLMEYICCPVAKMKKWHCCAFRLAIPDICQRVPMKGSPFRMTFAQIRCSQHLLNLLFRCSLSLEGLFPRFAAQIWCFYVVPSTLARNLGFSDSSWTLLRPVTSPKLSGATHRGEESYQGQDRVLHESPWDIDQSQGILRRQNPSYFSAKYT